MNLSTKQKQTHKHRQQTHGCKGKGAAEGGSRSLGLAEFGAAPHMPTRPVLAQL